ncbi:MAG TPA: hypothetical protein VD995_04960 [Azospirillum sp.]|nr:hypothetical protein [Azospirillum sp.]
MTSVLALAFAFAAVPAVAQSSSNNPSEPKAGAMTGTLPDNSLAEQRKGAITGDTVKQTGRQEGSSGASTDSPAVPSGRLPDDSLAEQRKGAIGGTVTQGGAGSTESPQQSKPGSGQ